MASKVISGIDHRHLDQMSICLESQVLSVPLTRSSFRYCVPRLAKVVNVFAIRQVKQGTGTTRFRIGFTLHSCQYDSSWLNNVVDFVKCVAW